MIEYEFLPRVAQNLMTAVRDMKTILERLPQAKGMTDLDVYDLNCLLQVLEIQHSEAEIAEAVSH